MALTKPPVLPPWAEAGDKVQPSNAEIQAGWPLSTIPPSRQRFNWLLNFLANGVRYFSRRGLPDYDAAETYMTGDRIIGDDGKTYRSLIDNNIGQTPSISPTKWELWALTQSQGDARVQNNTAIASAAGGTTDAITGSYTPAITSLTNGMSLYVRAGSSNATTTPTFKADGTAIKTIVKGNGLPLVAGDIAGDGHWIELQYDATLDKWVLLNPATGVAVSTVPAGEIAYFARNTAPSGYIKANGAAVSRSTYSALFAAIGTTFGAGDGSTTFNLPDLRGEFLRALDDGRGIDSGRTIGTSQDGTWVRTVAQEWSGSDIPEGAFSIGIGYAQADATINTSGVWGTVPTGAKAPSGEAYNTETTDNAIRGSAYVVTEAINNWIKMRPRNIALLACIKY